MFIQNFSDFIIERYDFKNGKQITFLYDKLGYLIITLVDGIFEKQFNKDYLSSFDEYDEREKKKKKKKEERKYSKDNSLPHLFFNFIYYEKFKNG